MHLGGMACAAPAGAAPTTFGGQSCEGSLGRSKELRSSQGLLRCEISTRLTAASGLGCVETRRRLDTSRLGRNGRFSLFSDALSFSLAIGPMSGYRPRLHVCIEDVRARGRTMPSSR